MTNVVNPILSVIYHSVGTTKPPPPVSYPDYPFPTTMTQSLTNPDSSDPTPSIVSLSGHSRPPSRQSTRVITPVKTHPLYIRPNNDARQSLATHGQSQSQSTNSEIQTAGHTQTTPVKSPRQRRVYRRNSGSQSKGRKHPSSAARSQKRKRGVIDDSDQSSEANSDPEIAVMDLAQDSDNNNSKNPEGWQLLSSMMLCCISKHPREP
ncbi:hypothetical protein MJO29_013691 [Puccinia striiformis f. sp. tritici]|nr:hypothetical protein MJO29_013691 [Puccinia striiformis f. sp. tritici]